MDDLDALLDAAIEKRTTEPESDTVDVLVGGDVWTMKFTEMDPLDWANAAAENQARMGSAIDRRYGHNYHATAKAAAHLCGVRLVGDDEVKLSEDQWQKLFKALAPNDFRAIADLMMGLNDFRPEQRLEKAKKALAAASAKKRPSRAK